MTKPVRIQLSRAKGFNLQAASIALNGLPAVKVDRSTRWGNPFRSCPDLPRSRGFEAGLFRDWLVEVLGATKTETNRDKNFRQFVQQMAGSGTDVLRARGVLIREALPLLRGKNLACWCPLPKLGEPDHCHANVLLEIANARVTISGGEASADAEVNQSHLPKPHRVSA